MNLYLEQRDNIPFIGKLGKLSENDIKRILSKVNTDILNKQNCWIWTGTIQDKIKKGHQHGCIWYNKKYVQVHRIMYHNYIEDVPYYQSNGIIVLHNCDNDGKCINPWHLRLGSKKENTHDALKMNTLNLFKPDEKNPMSKLSNLQINEIKSLKDSGISQKEIASKYDISQSQVSRYFNNKSRKNLQRLNENGGA